ncbi:hypothetical protein CCE02nite_28600 [Cellulosimicrobium cellulans]|uniref:Uncharacterized protein n=1 Tax=Cellulosimicrobium cellulans TaxID=1710 RepID=A0A4Y4E8B2_CELCE|nr:hypothetical protein CCE02nite_28600 [Cellulosimicrobium cellulans]
MGTLTPLVSPARRPTLHVGPVRVVTFPAAPAHLRGPSTRPGLFPFATRHAGRVPPVGHRIAAEKWASAPDPTASGAEAHFSARSVAGRAPRTLVQAEDGRATGAT